MNRYCQIYDKINQIIFEKYILLQDKGIDWYAMTYKYKKEIKNVFHDKQFVRVINDMLFELEDGHVNFSNSRQIPIYYLPFYFNFIQKNLVVTTDGIIPKGAIILKINGEKISDLITTYPSSFPLTAVKTRILENIYKTLKEKNIFEYLVDNNIFKKTVKGKRITPDFIKKSQLYIGTGPFSGIQIKKINEIQYLKIFMFVKGLYQSISDWLVNLPQKHNIIIDLRGCYGGDVSETVKVVALFLENKVNLGKKVSKRNCQYVEQQLIIEEYEIRRSFSKIVILVDNFTASSSEFIFLRALSKNKNVILVGEETAGIVHGTNKFIIDNTYLLTLTTHKYYDENNILLPSKGIMPDIFVPTNIKNDVDTCLETAIKILKT